MAALKTSPAYKFGETVTAWKPIATLIAQNMSRHAFPGPHLHSGKHNTREHRSSDANEAFSSLGVDIKIVYYDSPIISTAQY